MYCFMIRHKRSLCAFLSRCFVILRHRCVMMYEVGDEWLRKVCHYQQNVPQHYYILDTLASFTNLCWKLRWIEYVHLWKVNYWRWSTYVTDFSWYWCLFFNICDLSPFHGISTYVSFSKEMASLFFSVFFWYKDSLVA